MSFNLFVFERRKELKTSVDICNFMYRFTEYHENKDYNSIVGCSNIISKWSKKMFEKFPPLNGEYALTDVAKDMEVYLTDYSLGEHGVFCAFSYSIADEALKYAEAIADEYKVGLYNPQSNDAIFGQGIEILKYRTENIEDVFADWDNIEMSIGTLDSIERGTSNRNNAFITVWFEKDGKQEEEYIQCSPNYQKEGFLNSLLNKKKKNTITGYYFEIMKEDNLYQTELSSKEELIKMMKAWCVERKEPDISSYRKIL